MQGSRHVVMSQDRHGKYTPVHSNERLTQPPLSLLRAGHLARPQTAARTRMEIIFEMNQAREERSRGRRLQSGREIVNHTSCAAQRRVTLRLRLHVNGPHFWNISQDTEYFMKHFRNEVAV